VGDFAMDNYDVVLDVSGVEWKASEPRPTQILEWMQKKLDETLDESDYRLLIEAIAEGRVYREVLRC
jgi:hypothetical protein